MEPTNRSAFSWLTGNELVLRIFTFLGSIFLGFCFSIALKGEKKTERGREYLTRFFQGVSRDADFMRFKLSRTHEVSQNVNRSIHLTVQINFFVFGTKIRSSWHNGLMVNFLVSWTFNNFSYKIYIIIRHIFKNFFF